jgi:sirohydrochlorin ferrochelatase
MDIILLVGHGGRGKESNSLEDVAKQLHKMMYSKCKHGCVRTAYLQFTKPKLQDAIMDCVLSGASRIIVHPYFLSKGVHVTKNIPELIEEAKVMHPDIEFICTEPLGTHEQLAEIVLASIKAIPGLKIKVKNKKDKKQND